jgi:cytochrome c biogenesis protein CcdA
MWSALKSRAGTETRDTSSDVPPNLARCLTLGAVISFIGVPFAVPYFAVLAQILKADLSAQDSTLVLAAYNLAYAVPFALLPLLRLALGNRCMTVLERINVALVWVTERILPFILLLLGLTLTIDSMLFFWSGKGLI